MMDGGKLLQSLIDKAREKAKFTRVYIEPIIDYCISVWAPIITAVF